VPCHADDKMSQATAAIKTSCHCRIVGQEMRLLALHRYGLDRHTISTVLCCLERDCGMTSVSYLGNLCVVDD
jgi:hypothetical protein